MRLEPGMTKNGEGRAFPLTPPLRALLERRHEYTRRCERTQACIIPLVFHRKGRLVKSFKRTWAEACKKAGLPGLLFHDLRRTAVRKPRACGRVAICGDEAHGPQDRERPPALRRERSPRGGSQAHGRVN